MLRVRLQAELCAPREAESLCRVANGEHEIVGAVPREADHLWRFGVLLSTRAISRRSSGVAAASLNLAEGEHLGFQMLGDGSDDVLREGFGELVLEDVAQIVEGVVELGRVPAGSGRGRRPCA